MESYSESEITLFEKTFDCKYLYIFCYGLFGKHYVTLSTFLAFLKTIKYMKNVYSIVSLIWTRVQLLYSLLLLLKSFIITMDAHVLRFPVVVMVVTNLADILN